MKLAFIVGVGSFFGGMLRYLLSTVIQQKADSHFPFGTLLVNLVGCFVIGCLVELAAKWNLSTPWRLFLATGILGGFTTFSAFAAESSNLIKTGHTTLALAYILASIVLGICFALLGGWLFRFETGI